MNKSINIKDLSLYSEKQTLASEHKIVRNVDFFAIKSKITCIVGEETNIMTDFLKSMVNINNLKRKTFNQMEIEDLVYKKPQDVNWSQIRGKYISYVESAAEKPLNPTRKIFQHFTDVMGYQKYNENKKQIINSRKDAKVELRKYKRDNKNKKDKTYIKEVESLKKECFYNTKSGYIIKYLSNILNDFIITDIEKKLNGYSNKLSLLDTQKFLFALATLSKSKIIILNDPFNKLEAIDKAQFLNLISAYNSKKEATIIISTKDMSSAALVSDYIYIMYAGKFIEHGNIKEIISNAKHPYTWSLISSISNQDINAEIFESYSTVNDMSNLPLGDPYASRNPHALKIDFTMEPPLFEVKENAHYAATWSLHPKYPKTKIPQSVKRNMDQLKGGQNVKNKQ